MPSMYLVPSSAIVLPCNVLATEIKPQITLPRELAFRVLRLTSFGLRIGG